MLIGSVFSGIGGLDAACEWAWPGSRTAWQLDLVGTPVRRRHWPEALQVEADVRTVGGADLPRVDVLCGGFPCQDLSCAGKQAGLDGERSGLYREVLRFTEEIRPGYVVLENVPGLLVYLARLGRDFARLGYGLSWAVCEAADAGHPHLRRRVFVLAEAGGYGRGPVEVDSAGRWTPAGEREWATPRSNPGGSGLRGGDRAHEDGMLTAQVRPWATPAAGNPNEGESRESWEARRARVGEYSRPISEPLGQMVRVWPTVTSAPKGSLTMPRGNPTLMGAVGGSRLNPEWVEPLMGFPAGWTLPDGPRLDIEQSPRVVRGRYPADWDRSVPWPGYDWEAPRTLPDGPPCRGRPARIRALGNAVVPQQAALALRALLGEQKQGCLFGG